MSDATVTDPELEQRLRLLEKSVTPRYPANDPRGWPPSPVIDPDSFAGQLGAAQERKRLERVAAAEAEEAHQRELRKLEEERLVELWKKNSKNRERALRELSRVDNEIQGVQARIDSLVEDRSLLLEQRGNLLATINLGKAPHDGNA